MRKKYSENIGDVYAIPLSNGKNGIIQRAFVDINSLGYDIAIMFQDFFLDGGLSLECAQLSMYPKILSIYTNIYAGVKYNKWKFLCNCNLPNKYKIPIFKEYSGYLHNYDGIHKWKVYDPLTGMSRLPLGEFELEGLMTHVGFNPDNIERWLDTGSHGLTAEMFN